MKIKMTQLNAHGTGVFHKDKTYGEEQISKTLMTEFIKAGCAIEVPDIKPATVKEPTAKTAQQIQEENTKIEAFAAAATAVKDAFKGVKDAIKGAKEASGKAIKDAKKKDAAEKEVIEAVEFTDETISEVDKNVASLMEAIKNFTELGK